MPLLTQQQIPEGSRWRSLPGPSTFCSWVCPVSPCQQHHYYQSTLSSSPINIIMATACLLSQGWPVSPCQQHHHHHGNSLSSITGMSNVTLSSIIINNNHGNAKSLSSITGVSSVTLSSTINIIKAIVYLLSQGCPVSPCHQQSTSSRQ